MQFWPWVNKVCAQGNCISAIWLFNTDADAYDSLTRAPIGDRDANFQANGVRHPFPDIFHPLTFTADAGLIRFSWKIMVSCQVL